MPLVEELGGSRRAARTAMERTARVRQEQIAPGGWPIRPAASRPTTTGSDALLLRRRRSEREPGIPSDVKRETVAAAASYNSIDNIAEFFASRGKKFSLPKVPVEAPHGQARISARTEGKAPEIWRRHGFSARRRRGRCQDYGTISSLRFEEAGGEVRAVGARISQIWYFCSRDSFVTQINRQKK